MSGDFFEEIEGKIKDTRNSDALAFVMQVPDNISDAEFPLIDYKLRRNRQIADVRLDPRTRQLVVYLIPATKPH